MVVGYEGKNDMRSPMKGALARRASLVVDLGDLGGDWSMTRSGSVRLG